ncbi:MAG TPA: hypothetical protein VEC75_00580 [Stellaceae bacterium]|nr:hypothetical protein [Stellaceae bacterium]
MTTDAQLAANRANAALSTGPKTDAGKERAARNSLRHGLTSNQLVVFDETTDSFATFNAGIRLALGPRDEFEEQLVERIVLCQWRLRRAGRAEAAIVNGHGRNCRANGSRPEADAGFSRDPWKLEAVSRYEAALERALNRAYLMLERHQARRAERELALF